VIGDFCKAPLPLRVEGLVEPRTNGPPCKPAGFEGFSVIRARVFLADDNREILERVAVVLADEFDIVGAVCDGQALLDAAARLQPDVVILDISMPVLNGLEAAKSLRQSGSSIKIVFLTVNTNREVVRAALETGALGYVAKAHLQKDLVPAIKAALAGVSFVSPSIRRSKE